MSKKETNTKPKRYEINSLDKLLNVANKENINRLSIDFLLFLNTHVNQIEAIRKQYPKECEGKTNQEIATGSFIWIDDGKNDLTGVTFKDKDTGEVIKKIKFK